MKEYEIFEFCPTYNSDFQNSKLYPFQPALGVILKTYILKISRYLFKIQSYENVMKENNSKLYKRNPSFKLLQIFQFIPSRIPPCA